MDAVVRDLQQHRGRSLVIAGDQQPAVVHALGARHESSARQRRRNGHLYRAGGSAADGSRPIAARAGARYGGQPFSAVDHLGGNPVYSAPADSTLPSCSSNRFHRASVAVRDETSALCHWHVPEAHYLESWSDVRAYDGTASILQPLIAPLYGGRTAHELLSVLLGQTERTSYEIVRDYWQRQSEVNRISSAFGARLCTTASSRARRRQRKQVSVKQIALASKSQRQISRARDNSGSDRGKKTCGTLDVFFRPDPTILDGRFANNGWLQELPKPLTKMTWDNAVICSVRHRRTAWD